MAIRTLSEKRVAEHTLERQMRNWEIARSQKQKSDKLGTPPKEVQDFVTISRSAGLPGDTLADRLHDRLGWPVFDRDLLRTMAGDDACREQVFSVLDERAEHWLQAFVRGFMQQTFVGREAYFNRLVETVAALSRTAPGIFIGRGVDMILPRHVGIRIRLSASRAYCAAAYAREHNLTPDAAMREIEAVERDRARFIKQNFHVLPDESSRFDLIVNMEHISVDEAVDFVLCIMRMRGMAT